MQYFQEIFLQEIKRTAICSGVWTRYARSIGQYGFVALAYDTEGNLFGLHSLR